MNMRTYFLHRIQKNVFWIITLPMFLLTGTTGIAQQLEKEHLIAHKPLMNEVWETFDLLMYKVTKEKGKTIYTPYFPPKLARLHGKKVELQGYMIPIKSGFKHNVFLLSVLPIHQCMFCGQDGIPAMVEVTLANNQKERLKDRPVTVKGMIALNGRDKTKTEILITDAIVLGGGK